MDTSVSVCSSTSALTLPYHPSQRLVPVRYAHPIHVVVISTAGYPEESAHLRNRIFLFVPIDNQILYWWHHLFPTAWRKSRNSSFSIFRRLFYCLYSCNVMAGFLPRLFGGSPFFVLRLCLFNRLCIGRSPPSWKCSSISRCVLPCDIIRCISGSNASTFWYLLVMNKPPIVVSLSYDWGFFYNVRFSWFTALTVRGVFYVKIKMKGCDNNVELIFNQGF